MKNKFELAPYNTWVYLYTKKEDFDKAANCICDSWCNGAVSRREDGDLDLFINSYLSWINTKREGE